MKLYTNAAEITSAIKSIKTRGVKLSQDIHKTGVSCLAHIEKHGDITLLNNLLAALPAGWRKNALIAWAEAHGKVSFDTKEKSFAYDKAKSTDIEGATMIAPEDFKPEAEYKPMDLDAMIAAIIKKAEKADKAKGDKVDAAVLAKLKELV